MQYKSQIYCEHANENPSVCRCPADCACREHMCTIRPGDKGYYSKAAPVVPAKTPEIEDAVRVLAAMSQIGPNARRALVLIAERMAVGRKRYGEDFDRERDWTKEAQEEFLDGAIYLAIGASK